MTSINAFCNESYLILDIKKQSDDNLFTVDRKPDHNNLKLTRRQMAALMKRLKKREFVGSQFFEYCLVLSNLLVSKV